MVTTFPVSVAVAVEGPTKYTYHVSILTLFSPAFVAVIEEGPELSIMTSVQQKKKRTKIQTKAARRSPNRSIICSMSSGSDPSETGSFLSFPASMLCIHGTLRPGIVERHG